jgi:hypothetical protein
MELIPWQDGGFVLPLPYLRGFLRDLGPFEATRGEVGGFGLTHDGWGAVSGLLDVANLCSRAEISIANGKALQEEKIIDAVTRIKSKLFPKEEEAGALLLTIFDRGGMLWSAANPRHPQGLHLLWLASDELELDEVRLPGKVVDRYNSRARRAGTQVIKPGTRLLLGKYPACNDIVVRYVGRSHKCLMAHPEVIHHQGGDCDGDSPYVIVLPDSIEAGSLWASKQVKPNREVISLSLEGTPPRLDEEDGQDALPELAEGKWLIGIITSRFRTLPSRFPDLRVMELPMGKRPWATGMGLWIAEAAISKKSKLTLSTLKHLFGVLVLSNPGAVARQLMEVHEIFMGNSQEVLEVCQYLADNSINIIDRQGNVAIEHAAGLSKAYWKANEAIQYLEDK